MISNPLKTKRAICYIDGYNLYHGMKHSKLRSCYWLDLVKLATKIAPPSSTVMATKYFTTRARGASPTDPPARAKDRTESSQRQATYLKALETLATLEFFWGHYLQKSVWCDGCRTKVWRDEEKMTDVNIATELLVDAFDDAFDIAIIVSGDTDLIPPIEQIKSRFPSKEVVFRFPPKRHSGHLARFVSDAKTIKQKALRKCLLPDLVTTASGYVIKKPAEWA